MKSKKSLIGVGLFLAVAVVAVFIFLPGEQVISFEDSDDEIAYVRRYVPSVTVSNVSSDTLITVGKPLISGDTLSTGNNGFAMVLFLDETVARVSPSSQLVIRSALNESKNTNLRTQINLALGSLFMDVRRTPDSEFEVTTSTTVASIKGTRFGITSDNLIWVEEGEVEARVISTGQMISLVNKMYLQVDEDGEVESGELTDEELDELSSQYDILESDLIEREMRFQFRNRQGETFDEELRIFEQEEN
jgi:hypothetical protein